MQAFVRRIFSKEELLTDYWECVRKTVEVYGNKDFIITKNGALTFAENSKRANANAQIIRQITGLTASGVALFLTDPLEIVPAMVGVLRSGNYFVPLDVSFPDATLLAMLETADIKVILTNSRYREQIRSLTGGAMKIINLDELDLEAKTEESLVRYTPEDVVQILFTSGSTGQPKGAVEDYRYLLRAVYIHTLDSENEPEDRNLQLSTFTFSGPHRKVFSALVNGNSIHFYDLKADGMGGLRQWIRKQNITSYSSTPTVFRGFVNTLEPGETFPGIRRFGAGADRRLSSDIQAVKRHFPNVNKIRLGFTSTETQRVTSSLYDIDHDFRQENLPSGRPVEDIRVFIWDELGHSLPIGEEGEIVVYGDSLARGYLNNLALTRERFIPDPSKSGWQYFKTGDLGKLLPDGQLVHLGRLDNMVKIKGVRVEVDAIENYLLTYPGIVQVASRAFEDQKGRKKLVSYFVPERGIQVPVSDLRKHLAERLPRQMLPNFLVPLTELPLTGNGKVARSQLPFPPLTRPELSNPYAPPANDLERKFVQIWEEEIGISGIGVTDDFFDVGGDSLIGVLLFVRIEEAMGRNLPVSVLLTAATIRQQAELVAGHDTQRDFSPLILINSGRDRPPLFFIPGKGGFPTRIRQLARLLDSKTPIYGLQDLKPSNERRELLTVEAAASFYLSEIRKSHPHGPYILVGESMGGKIAYEMAQQFLKLGQEVPVLVLLDTYNTADSRNSNRVKNKSTLQYRLLFKKHANILLTSDWRGKLDYLRFYAREGWQRTKAFARHRGDRLRKEDGSAVPDSLRQIEEHNRQVSKHYVLRPYPGRLILFKALRGPNADLPDNGWDRDKLGELIIHPLDCYHGSVLFEPALSQLARILQSYIDQLP